MSMHLVERVGPPPTPEQCLGQAEYFALETRRIVRRATVENPLFCKQDIKVRKVNFTEETAKIELPRAVMDAYAIDVFVERINKPPVPEQVAKIVCSNRRFCIVVRRNRRHHFNDMQFHHRIMLLSDFLAGRPVGVLNRLLYL